MAKLYTRPSPVECSHWKFSQLKYSRRKILSYECRPNIWSRLQLVSRLTKQSKSRTGLNWHHITYSKHPMHNFRHTHTPLPWAVPSMAHHIVRNQPAYLSVFVSVLLINLLLWSCISSASTNISCMISVSIHSPTHTINANFLLIEMYRKQRSSHYFWRVLLRITDKYWN